MLDVGNHCFKVVQMNTNKKTIMVIAHYILVCKISPEENVLMLKIVTMKDAL